MLDLIVLLILCGAAWLGWRRGSVVMGVHLAGVLSAYLLAYLLYRPVGGLLAATTNLPRLVALPLGGLLVFMVTGAAGGLAVMLVERRQRQRRAAGEEPTTADRAGGAALAAVGAFAVVLVLAWGVESVTTLAGGEDGRTRVGGLASSFMEVVARNAARAATDDEMLATTAGLVVGRPGEGVRAVSTVLGSDALLRVATDPELPELVAAGDAEALARHDGIRTLMEDPAFVDAARKLGMLRGTEPGATPPEELATGLAEGIAPINRTVRTLQDDPEIRRLMTEMDVAGHMERGDMAALARDPQFEQLAERVVEALRRARN